jgi:hypothetical protein
LSPLTGSCFEEGRLPDEKIDHLAGEGPHLASRIVLRGPKQAIDAKLIHFLF